ncbi:hypothetical protein ND861_11560 [Leptospira sp. 2 VSF19]|uniref:DUF5683 domain-containing protein n=1 Tax=Leptospira soteropolitanensis TaxID=2950025 RepID=A0AAW5VP09_9LEPT|nr:hypothetical protein [Leptospira soteropolitanensis]MCW7493058.1 hypothetical protein [Leptospira soteropolitanensis]MCW7500872.1 hypothetical protein [Leptospira soteropolitanensis]MCW7522909.1 hypothetical protein [Leptospira soteropolitanensis]MCW7526985.1 hypothetical protein [Leptospira soteropolitanensis]MCW7530627.1 hypothetical protein [Leptospira soteropolitanensis]
MNIRFYLTLLISISLTHSLFPETVILKSGKTFYGSVIDQNREFLKLKEKNGIILQFPKIDILKVTYKDLNAKEVKKIIEVENKKNQPQTKNEIELDENISFESTNQNKKINPTENPKKIRWDVVVRSTILPGLGQFHWDEPVWGSVYLLTFLGAAINYHNAWNEHEKAKSEFQNDFRSLVILGSGNAGFSLYYMDKINLVSEYRSTANSLNTASDILISVFLINFIDSMLFRTEKNSKPYTSFVKKAGLNIKAEMINSDQFHLYSREQRITSGSVDYKIGYTWVF